MHLTLNRRELVKSIGVLSTVTLTGMAGCLRDDDGDGDGDTIPGDQYPAVDEWMTETSIGDADDTYDGTILDLRDEADISIDVGSSGNGDGYAFGPSAVAISAGTEVQWDWTGEGGLHNVEADAGEQIGESDYEFTSGEPVEGSEHEFAYTFDEPGIALYHCEPHLSLGMKGSIVIE